MEDYKKPFENQRQKMDEVLSKTYDLGQLGALNALIEAVDSGIWVQISYEKLVEIRDNLLEAMGD